MKTKILSIILTIASVLGLTLGASLPTFAECSDICSCPGVSEEIRAASGCSSTPAQLSDVIAGIINAVIAVLGIVAVIVIIYGGFQYMTSSGDAAKTKKAKDTILYAVIGLIICVLAFIITNFTINIINSSNNASSSLVQNSIAFFQK